MLLLDDRRRGGRAQRAAVNGLCDDRADRGGRRSCGDLPPGRYALFGGSFVVDDFARFLKLLALTGSAGALILSLDYLKLEHQQKFEYGALFLLSTLGMLMLISAADLIALYLGLETDEPGALRGGGLSTATTPLDRGRPEIFRAGRACPPACCSMAPRWSTASPAPSASPASPRRPGRRQHRPDLRPGVPVRRLLLQDFRGAVPHVDARRL